MLNHKLLLLFAIAALAWSCEETIQLDLDQTPEVVVIEGLITDVFTQHEVKLSKTAPFYSTGSTPRVSGAKVQVTDNAGNTFVYEEVEPGLYRANDAFAGVPGVTYQLMVEAEGKIYEASETLLPIGPIDSLTYEINEGEKADPEEEGRYYEVLLYTTEPQDTKDFYLFKFYRNDSLMNVDGQEIYYSDDTVIGEAINGLPAPVFYRMGDLARMEIYSLNAKAFRFFQDLADNLYSDGGMFSSPPSNISTNLSGGAAGYFQVSGLASKELMLEP